MAQAFEILDHDGDGSVSLQELCQVTMMASLSTSQASAMMIMIMIMMMTPLRTPMVMMVMVMMVMVVDTGGGCIAGDAGSGR